MQNYVVKLESEIFSSFRCQKAANSLDIDIKKKSKHELSVAADLKTPYSVGLIIGASGSGKTTLAKSIFGPECFQIDLKLDQPIIEQFPSEWSYDECAAALSGMGLTSVVCWIRPVYTLSNGQRSRAEAALLLAKNNDQTVVIDEWTSVVDRTVAKVMSHCVAKHARKYNKKIVLVSCHYDVIEWLNPDWIIDCNKQTYENRRNMVGTFERTDRLRLSIRECSKASWKYFSKYHYLNENMPGGKVYCFGLFEGMNQIGFICYAIYIPNQQKTYFFNRLVIHPDYCGLGLGSHLINVSAEEMVKKGFKVRAKFSSIPTYRLLKKDQKWRCVEIKQPIKKSKMPCSRGREATIRQKVKTFSFVYMGK